MGRPVYLMIMKKNERRTDIICIGMELIALHGYNATGIDAVLKQARVPKGSFYHFFGSKEEFGLRVIDHFADHCDEKLRAFFDDEEVAPLNRIRNYLENGLLDVAENRFTKGCLIGNLGQELSGQNERFRVRIETRTVCALEFRGRNQ
jgi:TetR/AcrR family transcriptional regulator, transcriptional repressor for nem operon